MSSNPYQPPSAFSNQFENMPPQRPAAATVFAILNIVFGVVGLCTIPLSAMMFFFPFDKAMTENNPALRLMEENTFYRLFMQGALGLGFIVAIVLIIAGVGLYQLKPYGRTLSIGYAIYGIVMNLVSIAVNCFLVFPALIEQANTIGPGPEQAGAYGGLAGGILGGCVGFIYPVILLIFMFRPNMIAAFKEKG